MRLLISVFVLVVCFGCSSEPEVNGMTAEEYVQLNHPDATLVEEGVYLEITSEGNGDLPTDEDFIFIDFESFLTDGEKVQDVEGEWAFLPNENFGWQAAIPLIKEGSEATIIVAPDKAYGSNPPTGIPQNSTIIFEVKIPEIFENQDIDEYIFENALMTEELDGGVHIAVTQEGTDRMPTTSNSIRVNYVGKLTSGRVFDSGTNVTFELGNLITGWQTGLKAMGELGEATLIIPADQGYGAEGTAGIPPGANLIFDVTLLDID